MPLPSSVLSAACFGDVSAVSEFLESGLGGVNDRSVFQSTLLHVAARAGRADVVRLLLDRGADINALDYVSVDCDMNPIEFGNVETQRMKMSHAVCCRA